MKIIDIPQSGKLGSFISFRNRHGQCRRPYVIPKNPSTPARLLDRGRMKEIAASWRELTDAQRRAWMDFASQVPCHGRLADSKPLSGSQLFQKINTNLAHVGEPRLSEPPSLPDFPDNPVGELCLTNTNGLITLQLLVPTAPLRLTLVSATAPCSPGVSFPGRFYYLGLLPAPVAGRSDITQLYIAKFGAPPLNTRLFLQTVQMVNGWQDYPKRTTALVPAR